LGKAAVLSWDSEIFGFPVGSYKIGAEHLDNKLGKEFSERFLKWAEHHGLRLCMCAVPAANSSWRLCLSEAGFRFVDFSLRVTLNALQTARLPEARVTLRDVGKNEWDVIEGIAEHAFRHGRYHADPLFSRALADLRYRRWIRNALSSESTSDRVYVMGEPGTVQGFYHVTINDNTSDLRLAALRPDLWGTMLGVDLYVSVLYALRTLGVRRAVTTISAANTAVMNIYSMLGFSFSGAETIYHWHAVSDLGAR
jgi:hypothetical protein